MKQETLTHRDLRDLRIAIQSRLIDLEKLEQFQNVDEERFRLQRLYNVLLAPLTTAVLTYRDFSVDLVS